MSTSKKILIVDTDPVVRHFLHRMLHIQGYDCVEATHGGEVIERLRTCQLGLIIADDQTPFKDGAYLPEALGPHLSSLSIPLIIMTRKEDRLSNGRTKSHGVPIILRKPLDYRQISSAVASVILSDGGMC